MKIFRLFLFLFISFGACLISVSQDVKFSHLGLKDGLSQTTVFAILQDKQGFMWFGTEDGLNKYDGYTFKVYSHFPHDAKSLTNNTILALFEDNNGMLFIGTNNGGLNIYDRENDKFISYKNQPDDGNSISGNKVFCIYQDKAGDVWIGTDAGLDKIVFNDKDAVKTNSSSYRNLSFKHLQNNLGNQPPISFARVRAILQDNEGALWFGTQGGGLNKLINANDNQEQTPVIINYQKEDGNSESLSDNDVLSLYEDEKGYIWVATYGGGLNRFDKETKSFQRFLHVQSDPNSIANNIALTIFGDKSKNIWVGTYGGGMDRLISKKDESGNLHYAVKHHIHNPINENTISNNSIGTIYEDRFGVIWAGTFGGAINKYDTQHPKFAHYRYFLQDKNSLPNFGVSAVYQGADGIMWIGTSGGGLTRVNRATNQFTHYTHKPLDIKSIPNNRISCLYEDQDKDFWVGTSGSGLCRFDKESGNFVQYVNDPQDPNSLPHNVVKVVFQDSDGILWIGTQGGGLCKFDKKYSTFITYKNDPENLNSLFTNRVRAIYEDTKGNIWIGNDVLTKFNKETEKFTHYKHNPKDRSTLSNNSVRSMYEDEKGFLWVGTLRGGLNKLNIRTGQFQHWRLQDGLPNDVVYGVLGDKNGNIWVSTNRGLSMLNVEENKFYNYDISDGLQSNEFSSGAFFKTNEGEMIFGGINGCNAFFPDSIKTNPYVPNVIITGLQIFEKEVQITDREISPLIKDISITDSLTFSYKDYVFSFDFSALHFSNSEKNKYAYKMTGLDDFDKEANRGGWHYIGTRRHVSFTNLEPGSYIFSVKGSNNDGIWNEKPTNVHITVVPPFWKTWWFYLLCLLGIALGLQLLIKGREKILRIQLKRSEQQIEDLKVEIKSQEDEFKKKEEELRQFIIK